MQTYFLTAILIATTGMASATVLFSDAGGGSPRTGDGFSLGAEFVVSASNMSVYALGFYDLTGGALLTAHEIGLWDVTASNAQVADATVAAGTTNGGTPGFLFVSLSSAVALVNGHTYQLAAYYTSGSPVNELTNCCSGAAPTTDPRFTNVVGAFTSSNVLGGLAEPNGTAGHAYVGPNLLLSPEPGSWAMVLAGAAIVQLLRRRK